MCAYPAASGIAKGMVLVLVTFDRSRYQSPVLRGVGMHRMDLGMTRCLGFGFMGMGHLNLRVDAWVAQAAAYRVLPRLLVVQRLELVVPVAQLVAVASAVRRGRGRREVP